MKVIALYLPQFHQIPENDKWWGEGFTEWTNMKKAEPIFNGHYQPRVPLDSNYYDLSDIDTLRWQAKIAKEHGVYAFCFYHYWFDGHLLLEKPMELLLENPDIDIKYCISWANENWTNGWVSSSNEILIGHDFDNEEKWEEHFDYLAQFFNDPRYLKEENKPLVTIYVPHHIKKLSKMLQRWDSKAKELGFDGLKYIYQNARAHFDQNLDKNLFDYGIEFNPGFIHHANNSKWKKKISIYAPKISAFIQKKLGIHLGLSSKIKKQIKKTDYDLTWSKILSRQPDNEKMLPCGFVDWDNSPRKGTKGEVYLGATPDKFEKYMFELFRRADDVYNTDKVFLFAWNEWAEGGYMEPDEKYGYGYLIALKNALEQFENERHTRV